MMPRAQRRLGAAQVKEQLRKGRPRQGHPCRACLRPLWAASSSSMIPGTSAASGAQRLPGQRTIFHFIVLVAEASSLTGQKIQPSGPKITSENCRPGTTERAFGSGILLFPFLQMGKLRVSSSLRWRGEGQPPFVKVPRLLRSPVSLGRQWRDSKASGETACENDPGSPHEGQEGRGQEQTCLQSASSVSRTG